MVFHLSWFSRQRLMGLPFYFLTGCLVVLTANGSAWAQLRSGSKTRVLYQTEAVEERAISRPLPNRESDREAELNANPNPVIQASHTSPRSPQSRPEPPRRVPSSSQPPAKLASCSNCNSSSPAMSGGRTSRPVTAGRGESILEGTEFDGGYDAAEHWDSSYDDGSIDDIRSHRHRSAPMPPPAHGYQMYDDMAHTGQCCTSTYGENLLTFHPLQNLWCRTSIRAEAPLFWRRGHSTPPLITTSPVGTAADIAGQLGRNTTDILQEGVFGQDARAGLRLTFSTYLDDCRAHAVVVRYWNAGTINDRNIFDSNDFPILARPFRNTSNPTTPANDTQLVAFPGDSFGRAEVHGRSELYGLDIGLKRLIYSNRFSRVHWTYGYQQVSLGERLAIHSETTVIGNLPPLQGATIAVSDHFRTNNRFNGTNFGLQKTRRFGCFHLETLIQLGLGNLRREVQVSGMTTTSSAGSSSSSNEGLLARQTNSRRIVDDTFVITPEVGVNLAYALTPGIDFTIGYNYMMVPKVYQASSLMDPDLRVNLSDPLVGQLDPQLNLQQTRYWVRSLGLGLQIRY
jgi:hypothetical protein